MSTKKKLLEAAAGNAGGDHVYVDDVFSTYLYTGTGSVQTITNNIDLADEGGLVWTKSRSNGSTNYEHALIDTERGWGLEIQSNSTAAETGPIDQRIREFTSTGYVVGNSVRYNEGPTQATTYASWTFRKAPGFFDVVTYTGNGVAGREVAHNLGSVPGMVIVKSTSGSGNWVVQHIGTASLASLYLNENYASWTSDNTGYWNNTAATSSSFTLGTSGQVNGSGVEYVAYVFAHDAQDFGTDSDESIIKCGSYTGNGSTDGPEIDLGFEAQWVLIKNTGTAANWIMADNMRGMSSGGNDPYLQPNSDAAEYTSYDWIQPTASGFKLTNNGISLNSSGSPYIYMAIRRPHKPAEEFDATDLFNTDAGRSDGLSPAYELGFPPDMGIQKAINGSVDGNYIFSRLTGNKYVFTDATSVEATGSAITWDYMNGIMDYFNGVSFYNAWGWRRAPGFFDVVTYDGFLSSGGSGSKAHNLNAVPEMMVFKNRSTAYGWYVWHKDITAQHYLRLDQNAAETNFAADWVGADADNINFGYGHIASSQTGYSYIAYLFATVPGISKIGSYTGTGSDLNVDCGFSAGARFILIKRTDSTGDWYYWDTLRGIVAGNDPYLLLNSSAAQVTNTDYIDPLASGFTVTSSAPAALNASGGTYIFYAIA
jgi:hypothetical protein